MQKFIVAVLTSLSTLLRKDTSRKACSYVQPKTEGKGVCQQ